MTHMRKKCTKVSNIGHEGLKDQKVLKARGLSCFLAARPCSGRRSDAYSGRLSRAHHLWELVGCNGSFLAVCLQEDQRGDPFNSGSLSSNGFSVLSGRHGRGISSSRRHDGAPCRLRSCSSALGPMGLCDCHVRGSRNSSYYLRRRRHNRLGSQLFQYGICRGPLRILGL